MTASAPSFHDRLDVLRSAQVSSALTGIKHGVERETLRINSDGTLATTPHSEALGAALTHDSITTDFSESLLEFITPPDTQSENTLAQLRDIHRFVIRNIGDERLWPMSMPCYIDDEDQIPLAKFGSSNVGRMKTLYRKGLKNRYGSMMQAIAGVHFNFSLPDDFWQAWLASAENTEYNKNSVSAAYFAMIRNYRRLCWMIPFLFGASPALCGSFVKGKKTSLPFKTLGKGTMYLPYATSLRMSDLGYTNSAQSGLAVCYNDVDSYIASLRAAKSSPSAVYQAFAGKKDGEYQQLNANVLQIENELYSPIRPKQPTQSLEKPTDALEARGVNYIEVRALDVDPFSDVGISKEHFYFLDVFLLYCLVQPSEKMNRDTYQETEDNLRATVVDGRNPELRLRRDTQLTSVKNWAEDVFSGFREIAALLDEVHHTSRYSAALASQWAKFEDPSLTPSGKLLDLLLESDKDNGIFGVELAEQYRNAFLNSDYEVSSKEQFESDAKRSLAEQADVEAADNKSFDEFLQDYFSDLKAVASLADSVNKTCA